MADSRPPPQDLSHHLSRNAKAREASQVKRFYKYFQIPGIGQLAGGLPNRYYFPFDTLEAKIALPHRWEPTPNRPVDPPLDNHDTAMASESDPRAAGSRLVVPHGSQEPNPLRKIDLETALQYGQAQGYPPLYGFLRKMTNENMHPNIPYQGGAEIILSCGNTDGWSKVLQTLTNEWDQERDWARDREGVLCEKFAFMNAIQGIRPRGLNVVPVEIDDEGMLAEGKGGLRDVLKNWDHKRGKRPHLMYTVTMGQNPTSGVLSLKRRKDLYAICSKYDVIIVEDDPYWYLQYPSSTARAPNKPKDDVPSPNWKKSGYDFLDSLVPSSLNIDVDGRVIRLDTFSKTVAPGCRLGWITGQPALIERILRVTETSTQQPSGFVQSMIAEMIMGPQGQIESSDKGKQMREEGWKTDGWIRWLEGLRGNYERRMNTMCKILDAGREQVKSGRRNSLCEALSASSIQDTDDDEWSVVEKTTMYSFDWPVGGMFVWLRVHFENHPLAGKVDGPRFGQALWVFLTTKPHLVLVGPGQMFSPTEEIRNNEGWQYYRLCFAAADEPEIAPISQRVADGIKAFWRIKSTKTIDDLLKELENEPKLESRMLTATGLGNLSGVWCVGGGGDETRDVAAKLSLCRQVRCAPHFKRAGGEGDHQSAPVSAGTASETPIANPSLRLHLLRLSDPPTRGLAAIRPRLQTWL
ncbi:aromatic amino acid aminotransferase 1 [Myriangium duriaei CBS 260.36]|uniref:Aromatic amino acid aminotransferase 1 n=1 Tax=Myriangium duriaei CBS 260.36 TaxID=1168546 RepID=A0A9P4JDA1_9PEZI|nr:aromatic amino acid aminotransferase 1 [Myriangium duriaei CBS 260.36]